MMKKIKVFVKKNYKIVISFILGMIVCIGIGVSAVATKDITYDNSKSGLTSTNLQGAIDELNTKAKTHCPDGYKCIKTNIVAAYTYNQTSGASNYCVTGEESTCVETTCYENQSSGSCPAGTIVKYKVNDSDVVIFHVMFDEGNTMTMQSQKNNTGLNPWYKGEDNTQGPTNILSELESATSGWTNVNNQTYTMGTTVFKTNAYTGCSSYNSCTTNRYTLGSRTAKARMITVQEAAALGCTDSYKSCPIWMWNYLHNSISGGGTADDDGYGYWTMSAETTGMNVWYVSESGKFTSYVAPVGGAISARAVVVVNK